MCWAGNISWALPFLAQQGTQGTCSHVTMMTNWPLGELFFKKALASMSWLHPLILRWNNLEMHTIWNGNEVKQANYMEGEREILLIAKMVWHPKRHSSMIKIDTYSSKKYEKVLESTMEILCILYHGMQTSPPKDASTWMPSLRPFPLTFELLREQVHCGKFSTCLLARTRCSAWVQWDSANSPW